MAPEPTKKEEGGKGNVNKKESSSNSKDNKGNNQKQETPRNKHSEDKNKGKSDNTRDHSAKKEDKDSKTDNDTQNDNDKQDTARSETGTKGESKQSNEKSKGGNKQDGEKQKKEYFKEELNRLKGSLQKEKEKIKKPEKKEHSPYIFNTLEPYYNVHTAKYLIDQPGEVKHGSVSRLMSKGLVDPWVDHKMDIDLLPKIDSKPVTSPRGDAKGKKEDKDRPPKAGSTRLPAYPAVKIPKDERSTKPMYYDEVPGLREELHKKYSTNASSRIEKEYNRTKQDFYRMELDKLDEYHPENRDNMKATYYAYLTNNPGSKKAIKECVGEVEKKEKEKEKEKGNKETQKQESDNKSQTESKQS